SGIRALHIGRCVWVAAVTRRPYRVRPDTKTIFGKNFLRANANQVRGEPSSSLEKNGHSQCPLSTIVPFGANSLRRIFDKRARSLHTDELCGQKSLLFVGSLQRREVGSRTGTGCGKFRDGT